MRPRNGRNDGAGAKNRGLRKPRVLPGQSGKKSRSKGIEERPLSDLEPFTRLERIREALSGLRKCDMPV